VRRRRGRSKKGGSAKSRGQAVLVSKKVSRGEKKKEDTLWRPTKGSKRGKAVALEWEKGRRKKFLGEGGGCTTRSEGKGQSQRPGSKEKSSGRWECGTARRSDALEGARALKRALLSISGERRGDYEEVESDSRYKGGGKEGGKIPWERV